MKEEIMERLEKAYNEDVTSEITLLDAVRELLDYYNSQGHYKDEEELMKFYYNRN